MVEPFTDMQNMDLGTLVAAAEAVMKVVAENAPAVQAQAMPLVREYSLRSRPIYCVTAALKAYDRGQSNLTEEQVRVLKKWQYLDKVAKHAKLVCDLAAQCE